MKNPFEYGSIVQDDSFCNRTRELADIRRAMENGEHLFLFAERRLGKTSLVKRALSTLASKDHIVAYMDLWPTDSEASFVSTFASTLVRSANSTPQKMLEFAKNCFGSLAPSITVDSEGNPQIAFGRAPQKESAHTLHEVLSVPGLLAARHNGKRLVIVLDEFQQIFEYETDLVERELRSAMQQQNNVSYILLGSRKHLIQKMVLDRSRSLYRAGMHYPLGPIASEHWLPFIQNKFSKSNKQIAPALCIRLCELTQGHPFYTQHLCHALWEATEEGSAVTEEGIEQALTVLLAREDYAYNAMWDALTLSQRRLIEGLSFEPPNVAVYSANFLNRYEITSASTAQRAIKALVEKDIIDKEQDSFFVVDRFFKIWIARKHHNRRPT